LAATRVEAKAAGRRNRESPPPQQDATRALRAGNDLATPPVFVLDDPASAMPPVARRLLDGALRVFVRGGLEKVTFDAVAAASGEPSSATTYYFGEKRNLIVAMHDVLLFRAQKLALRELRRAGTGAAGHPLAAIPLQAPAAIKAFRTFYELLPAILRDEELQSHQVAFLAWLRSAAATACESRGVPWSAALVDLSLAVAFGLPLQLLIDRGGLAALPVLKMWSSLVTAYRQ
jgi:AcrR family transcriptional regulator